ncbi:monocarboxylate transporter 12-like [Tubulanus polymorphus]|uniref:monocarboxylate transporter 12-like n=1 Tax=Tubulanus polymorphus TaxID=672921 RepID=UPI003DA2F70A
MELEEDPARRDEETVAPPIAPDGGWGWIVVIAAFIVYVIADGCTFSFGVFYTELLDYFQQSKGKTAIIVGLLYGFPLLISPFICALVTSFGCRIIGRLGGIFTGFAFLISIFATSVEFLCFTIGLIGSVGLAMCYLSSIVSVSFYFDKRRGLATGLAVCGSGIGTLVFAPLIEAMLVQYSWRGSLLLISGICFNMLITGAAFIPVVKETNSTIRPASPAATKRLPGIRDLRYRSQYLLADDEDSESHCRSQTHRSDVRRKASLILSVDSKVVNVTESCPELTTVRETVNDSTTSDDKTIVSRLKSFWVNLKDVFRSMIEPSIAKNVRFLMFCGSNFLLCLWFGVPYVYITDFARLYDISMQDGSLLVSVIGISSMFGQIGLGFLSDKSGRPVLIYAVAMCLCGGAVCFVPVCFEYWAMCLAMSIFGFFIGANYALATLIVIELVGLEKMPIAFGWLQLGQGIATLTGTPLAGLMYDLTGDYDLTFSVAGAWIILSGLILFPVIIKDNFFSTDKTKLKAAEYSEVPVIDL